MRELIKQYSVRLSRSIIRILLRKGIFSLFVRLLVSDRQILESFMLLFVDKTDLVGVAQSNSAKKFFCIDESLVEQVLEGRKLTVFDVGAAGNIEPGLNRYRHLLNVIAVEPRHDLPLESENREDFILIPKLMGSKEGKAVLNVTRKETNSSIHEPIGAFLSRDTSGKHKRKLDIVKTVEFPMTTIEAVLKETSRQVHYLKLDTQGNELDILEGLGEYRPIIIKVEISFVPKYKDQTIFFHLAKFLYDMGYAQFHLSYGSKSSLKPRVRPFAGTLIPIHGDAWFMPDWTRKNGREIIKEREKEYEALMLIFGLSEIYEDALDEYKVSNNHHESD